MTILTGRELEVLIGLRMSWGKLYSKEITRLQNEDDSNRAVDAPIQHIVRPALMPMETAHLANAAVDLEQRVLAELEDRTTTPTGHEPCARTCEPHRGGRGWRSP
jgi:hypothetical protein